jgi:ferredoxin-thioredoxin reductase catalytic subunit
MWEKMTTCIWKVASEVYRATKESGDEAKDIWCWNEEVQRAIKEKQKCYRRLYHDMSMDNIEKYKVAKKTTMSYKCGHCFQVGRLVGCSG